MLSGFPFFFCFFIHLVNVFLQGIQITLKLLGSIAQLVADVQLFFRLLDFLGGLIDFPFHIIPAGFLFKLFNHSANHPNLTPQPSRYLGQILGSDNQKGYEQDHNQLAKADIQILTTSFSVSLVRFVYHIA